jgi:hypothetical protein
MADTMVDCGAPRDMVPGSPPGLAASSCAPIELRQDHTIRHVWFRAKQYLAAIACAMAMACAAISIELIDASPASAYALVDRGPGWVDKFSKYFDEFNEFNRTHSCMTQADYDKLAEIWRTVDQEFRDDIDDLDKLQAAARAKVDELDEKMKKVQANYEAALQVSTHTVHNPADYIAELTKARDEYAAESKKISARINALNGIQFELQMLYRDIQAKPLCKEGEKSTEPPPPVYVGRCPTQQHVQACLPCKVEVGLVNDAIDRQAWSFGDSERCRTGEKVIADMKAILQACIKERCTVKKTGYVPGRQLRDGEFYVSLDGNKWCTFGAGVPTTAMLSPVDDDDSVEVSMASSPDPNGPANGPAPVTPTSDKLPTPDRTTSDKPRQPTDKPIPYRPVTDTPTQPTTTTDVTPTVPDDTPSEIPDNVEMKVKQETLKEGQTGEPIEGQTIKLAQSDKDDLPVPLDPSKPAPTRTAESDRGFDKPTSQCVTDAKGSCTIPVSADDRPHFHLPELAKGKHQNYQLEITQPLTSGGVAEILPGKDKIDPKTLQSAGHSITSETFKIGERTFARFSLQTSYDADEKLSPKLAETYGPSYETDLCKEKYPDGPFDSAGKHGSELPGAVVTIRRSRRPASVTTDNGR